MCVYIRGIGVYAYIVSQVPSSQYVKNVLQREITADSERTERENSERLQRESSGRMQRDPRGKTAETPERDFREKTPARGFRER
jgi:hypothetical protein